MGGLPGRSPPGHARPVRTWAHLARRFFQSLLGRGPDPEAEAWLLAMLNPAEAGLYRRMSRPDRAHAVRSARHAALTNDGLRVAAGLHDVGKTEAGLGTAARVGATLAGAVCPGRLSGRWAQYRDHPELGAALLREAGSAHLAVVWAAEHHLTPDKQSLPPEVAATLAAAD